MFNLNENKGVNISPTHSPLLSSHVDVGLRILCATRFVVLGVPNFLMYWLVVTSRVHSPRYAVPEVILDVHWSSGHVQYLYTNPERVPYWFGPEAVPDQNRYQTR